MGRVGRYNERCSRYILQSIESIDKAKSAAVVSYCFQQNIGQQKQQTELRARSTKQNDTHIDE